MARGQFSGASDSSRSSFSWLNLAASSTQVSQRVGTSLPTGKVILPEPGESSSLKLSNTFVPPKAGLLHGRDPIMRPPSRPDALPELLGKRARAQNDCDTCSNIARSRHELIPIAGALLDGRPNVKLSSTTAAGSATLQSHLHERSRSAATAGSSPTRPVQLCQSHPILSVSQGRQ